MAETTGIEWAHATWSPWGGCQAVSPGCDHCYAQALDTRFRHAGWWGANGLRNPRSAAYWRLPEIWNARAGGWFLVFPSMCDPFDNHPSILPAWRAAFWALIRRTPNLTWLLLTKRPQNVTLMLPPDWRDGWRNVWLGVSAENQVEAERRIPLLLLLPARRRFLSVEPMLGPVRLRNIQLAPGLALDALTGAHEAAAVIEGGIGAIGPALPGKLPPIDWVIAGGESGSGARPMSPAWLAAIRDDCASVGVSFFFKQWGSHDASGRRVGKARAEARLDGREHREFPDGA